MQITQLAHCIEQLVGNHQSGKKYSFESQEFYTEWINAFQLFIIFKNKNFEIIFVL